MRFRSSSPTAGRARLSRAENHRPAHGSDLLWRQADEAFDVVIPSLPGYGFSGQPDGAGLGPGADRPCLGDVDGSAWLPAFRRVRRRLGRPGHRTAGREPLRPRPSAIHLNLPSAVPPEIFAAIQGGPTPPGLSPDESHALQQLKFFFDKAWLRERDASEARRPSTRLEDSPIGLAAWILDHDTESYRLIARIFDGVPTKALPVTTSSTTSRSIG